jgi:hypothetical protein
MRSIRVRFSLWHLMIAVAVIACFLVLLGTPRGFLIICVLWSLALAAMFWGLLRDQRRRAWWCFGIVSFALNWSFAALSICACYNMWGMAAMFLGSLCGIPMILGFGTAWAAAATRRETVRRRSPLVAWSLVIAVAALPLTMLFTHWPLRVAFLASQPALDRLANRVAGGQSLRGPVRAGFFNVISSAVDPSSGNIGLIIDPDPSGRSGFVRPGPSPSAPPSRLTGPFYNLDFDLELFDGWRYQTED